MVKTVIFSYICYDKYIPKTPEHALSKEHPPLYSKTIFDLFPDQNHS